MEQSIHDLAYCKSLRNEDLKPVIINNLDARIIVTQDGVAIQGYFVVPVVRDGDDLHVTDGFEWIGNASVEWLRDVGHWIDEDVKQYV
jgi:hypothetical protein